MSIRSERRAVRAGWTSLAVAVVAALLGIWRESDQWWLTAAVFVGLAALCSLGSAS